MSTFSDIPTPSRAIVERALQVLPGGNTRSTVYVPPSPPYARSGRGCRVTDVDDHTVVDCNNNYTSLIHGHAHPQVVAAARDAIDRGSAVGLPTESEVELAAELRLRLPRMTQWRFTNSGSEAVMLALRIARAVTGRDLVVRFAGSYHGSYDGVLDPGSKGVAAAARSSIAVGIGQLDEYLRVLTEHGHRIAAVIVDLMPNRAGLRPIPDDFVTCLRRTTCDIGALLVVDEVITFRLACGGLQSVYGVEPDLTVLGKVIGGGFPIGAVGGHADVMSILDPRLGEDALTWGGTFNANPVSMSAGLATLQSYHQQDAERLNQMGDELRAYLAASGLPVAGKGSLLRVFPDNMRAFWWAAYDHGILLCTNGLLALSTPMTSSDVEQVGAALVAAT